MEARISSIMRNVFQMNVSTSTKDPKYYEKNVGILNLNPLIAETFETWYTQYRDIYENGMADLPSPLELPCSLVNLTEVVKFVLLSSNFQPRDPADLTYKTMIRKLDSAVSENSPLFNFIIISLSKKTNSDVMFSFLVFDHLAMLRFDSDCYPSWTRIRHCPINGVAARITTTTITKKASTEHLLTTESINSDEAGLWSTPAPISNTVQLYVSMRCETAFLEKTIFKGCHVKNPNINLMGPDWIDGLNLISSHDEN
ncbi:unnamed protein product [Hymenolepis diminuta]|uniref:DDE-1 domain-containing protein n=1 Tax=Hymenolepis diminuta TaxID=6216 RepID=A0A0R3STR5_HYMDI|nr:unnamed protein product [Hymenolepis diminuta]